MPWTCKLFDVVDTKLFEWPAPEGGGACGETRLIDSSGNVHSYDDLPPGTMFSVPANVDLDADPDWPWYWAKGDWLSDYYRQNNAGRRPLFVVLPGRHCFLIDGKCWNKDGKYGGWTITGEAPLITVAPSINIVGSYHGWLQNGVISDDCEGRTFGPDGKRL